MNPRNVATRMRKLCRALELVGALAKLQEPVVLGVLTQMAQTNNATLRRRVAEALGDYTAPNVTNTLSLLRVDADQNVRETAAISLRRVQAALR